MCGTLINLLHCFHAERRTGKILNSSFEDAYLVEALEIMLGLVRIREIYIFDFKKGSLKRRGPSPFLSLNK